MCVCVFTLLYIEVVRVTQQIWNVGFGTHSANRDFFNE